MKIVEVTGDDKFDKMLKGITTSNDTEKYNQMIGNVTSPATFSKEEHGNHFFFAGDKILNRLQDIVSRRTDRDRALINGFHKMSLDDVNAWIADDIGIDKMDVNDVNDALHLHLDSEDVGDYPNLVEFFKCKDVTEFKINFLNPWIDYKDSFKK